MTGQRSKFDHVVMLGVFTVAMLMGLLAVAGLSALMLAPIGRYVVCTVLGVFVALGVYRWLLELRNK